MKFKAGDRVRIKYNTDEFFEYHGGEVYTILGDIDLVDGHGKWYDLGKVNIPDSYLELNTIPFSKLSRKMYPNAKIVEENGKKYLQL